MNFPHIKPKLSIIPTYRFAYLRSYINLNLIIHCDINYFLVSRSSNHKTNIDLEYLGKFEWTFPYFFLYNEININIIITYKIQILYLILQYVCPNLSIKIKNPQPHNNKTHELNKKILNKHSSSQRSLLPSYSTLDYYITTLRCYPDLGLQYEYYSSYFWCKIFRLCLGRIGTCSWCRFSSTSTTICFWCW